MSRKSANPYRDIPSVNDLADAEALTEWSQRVPRSLIVEAARQEVESLRTKIAEGNGDAPVPSFDALAAGVSARLEKAQRPPLASVINATGVIIHTGLGRAPLAEAAVDALADVALHYAPVELDLSGGERGQRNTIVRPLLRELTGAESAVVVNNNAAALLLALAALAKSKEVIVSRGELIEIGGSFRLPDVMAASGAVLREVGTTNKTRPADYAAAINENTAALLKVHPSNYVVSGFVEEASIESLVEIGREHDLPVIHDIGSGALADLGAFGLVNEPVARRSIEAGADVVLFSGDKLLGGPQAGILIGKAEPINRIEKHPLMRAMRVDKLTLAALGATLQLHRDAQQAMRDVPVLAMIATPIEQLRERGEAIALHLTDHEGIADACVVDTTCYLGGGALPTQGVASVAVSLRPTNVNETGLAQRLRRGDPAVVPRVQDGALLLELRTVFPQQDAQLVKALRSALEGVE